MQPVKSGVRTTEILALIAGLLTAVIPVIMDKVPADSIWAPILGAIVAAAAYIGGRSWVKVAASKADAMKSIGAQNPQ